MLLSFLIGNGDMHLKNWALLTGDDGNVALSPCYDFVSSKIYIPNEDDLSLGINGKRNKLSRTDFEAFAQYLRINPKAAENSFRKLQGAKEQILGMSLHSEISEDLREKLMDVINSRYDRLGES